MIYVVVQNFQIKAWQSSQDTSNFISLYIPLNDSVLSRKKTQMMLTLAINCGNRKWSSCVELISIEHRARAMKTTSVNEMHV